MAGQQRMANVNDPVTAAIEPALKVGAACGKLRNITCPLLIRMQWQETEEPLVSVATKSTLQTKIARWLLAIRCVIQNIRHGSQMSNFATISLHTDTIILLISKLIHSYRHSRLPIWWYRWHSQGQHSLSLRHSVRHPNICPRIEFLDMPAYLHPNQT